jgi:hypothetical protein
MISFSLGQSSLISKIQSGASKGPFPVPAIIAGRTPGSFFLSSKESPENILLILETSEMIRNPERVAKSKH